MLPTHSSLKTKAKNYNNKKNKQHQIRITFCVLIHNGALVGIRAMSCGTNKSNLIYGTLIYKEDRNVSRLKCDRIVINYTSLASSRLNSYPWSVLTVSCMGWLLVSRSVMHSIPASSAFRPIMANGRRRCSRF